MKTTDPQFIHNVTCVAQDPRAGHTQTWFYGTGEWFGSAEDTGKGLYRGDGIFRSTDGGVTWQQLASTASNSPQTTNDFDYMYNLVVDPTTPTSSPSTIVAATSGGIMRSDDGGTTWTRQIGAGAALAFYYTDVAVTSTGVFYATLSVREGIDTVQGLFRSPDGVTWTEITPTGWPTGFGRTVIGTTPPDEDQVLFLSYTPGSGQNNHSLWHYTYLSGDGTGAGGSWENRSSNLPNLSGSSLNRQFRTQRGYDMFVAVSPTNEDVVLLGGVNLWRSTTGFTTPSYTRIGGYEPTNETFDLWPNHHPDQHAVAFYDDFTTLLSAHDGGLSRTTNYLASNVEWTSLNNNYLTTQFYSVATESGTAGSQKVIGGLRDNGSWFSALTANNWADVTGGDGSYAAIPNGAEYFFTSSQYNQIYRAQMDNDGVFTATTLVSGDSNNRLFINPFILDVNQETIYYAASNRIGRILDATESAIDNEILTDSQISWFVTTLEMAGEGNWLYYGSSDGRVYRLAGPRSSTPNLEEITGSNFPDGAYVSSIAVDPTDEDRVLVAFSNYEVPSLFYTLDGGSTWFDVSGNLEENPDGSGNGPSVRWVDILRDGPQVIYFAGTSTGLYSTTQLIAGSTNWGQEGASTIGNVVVDMVQARQLPEANDGYVVVGTHGNGVYDAFYPIKRVAGTIRDAEGTPVEGVVLDGLPGNPSTDAQGNYSATIDWEWTGTVTPTKPGYTFSPASIVYDAVPAEHRPYDDFLAVPDVGPRVPTVGLDLWWKESGMHGLATLGSDPDIFRWDDASGNGRDLVQLSPSRRPLYAPNGVRGYPAVRFDGTDDLMTHSGYSLDGRDEATVFAVMRTDNSQGGRYLVSMPKDVTGLNGFDLGFTSTRVRSNLKTTNGFTTAEAVENYYDGDGHILTGRYWADGILATHRVYYDGGQEDAENTSGTIEAGANRVYLGGFSASYSAYYSGELAEVLVYNRSLGIAERTAVENYLGLKYGIGRRTVADPSVSGGLEGVLVLGSIGAAVSLTDGPSQSGSLSATTGTNPSVVGSLPSGVGAILPDQYWSIEAFLSDYTYSITFDLRDFDLGGVAFDDLTALKRDDGSSPWQDVRSLTGVTLVHHEPYLTASGLTGFSDFAIGVTDGAAGLLVTTESDAVDANAGNCDTMQPSDLPGADGVTSLREAICAANNDSPRTVTLPAGTYVLSIPGTEEDGNATGDLDILDDLTLTGAGARTTTIDATGI
ncbi:MAG: hypothetical protein GVY18_06840, partial [Bacteroidetes bacterium]|nr:hypothetical protein [Bacteroidota bacterium]